MELRPTTEKVPARRAVPLAVALAALATLGVLVAQPWDRAGPTTSPRAALSPDAEVALTTASPTAAPTSTSARSIPTPDVAPLGPIGDLSFATDPDSPMARCDYGRERRGALRLVRVEVQPPVVLLDAGSSVTDIRRVGWWFELEMNREENIFHREWLAVGRSRAQVVAAVEGRPARFTSLSMPNRVREMDPTTVFRVLLVVEWYTRNVELAGRAEVVANRYQEADNQLIGSWPGYCHAFRPAPR